MRKYGEYSKGNAIEFSLKTAEQYGWSSYGDMDYVPHVLRYYPLGQILYDPDTTQLIVEVAASQIGNVGGEPYWSWYGFTERVPTNVVIWIRSFQSLPDAVPVCNGSKPETNGQTGLSPRNRE